jgi:hypothetical protein
MKSGKDERGVMVQAGDTIGRRFRLVRSEDYDIPGATLFLARDLRLEHDVTVHVLDSLAPSSVIRAARRAQVVRDRRLTRVLAAASERHDGERLAYVVSERPVGVRLDALLGQVAFLPVTAAALVGDAAATLNVPGRSGVHHGMIRARSLTITPRGRVIMSGLGIEGELASQAGLGRGRSERVDAVALARIYVTAVTAMDPDEVTSDDLPDDLPKRARDLCESLLRGSGPLTLAQITEALGTGRPHALRAIVAEAPTLFWPPAPQIVEETDLGDADAVVAEAVVADAVVATVEPEGDVAAPAELEAGPAVELAEPVDPASTRLRTRFGGAVDDIDEFHDIVSAQNATPAPSVLEAFFERLHQRFPRSAPLADLAIAAHRRAQTTPPFNVGPLLVALLIVALFVAAVIGASIIAQPIDPPEHGYNNPSQTYPEFTVGQTPPPGNEG